MTIPNFAFTLTLLNPLSVDGLTSVRGEKGDAGNSAYTYIAYADDASGAGFTNTFSNTKNYIAVKTTTTAISSPIPSDFTGLWKNYVGGTSADAVLAYNSANSAATSEANSAISETNSHTSEVNAAVSEANTLTYKNAALAAEVAAEAARDQAQSFAGIYATTAAGIAVVAVNGYFCIPSAGTNDYLDLYRVDSGTTATYLKTFPSSTVVAAIQTGMDFVAAKNRYDPSVAVDGQVYSFTTGIPASSANNIISGKVSVVEGQTYTFSQPSPEVGFRNNLYMWNSSNTFLGIAVQEGAVVPYAGVSLTASQAGGTGGFRQLTFTPLVGSGVAYVATQLTAPASSHTTGDFNRIKAGVMLEYGATATTFEAYTTLLRPIIKITNLPQSLQDIAPDFSNVVCKNIFNASLAVDGRAISTSTGANTTSANIISFGHHPVVAGKTYTLSIPEDSVVGGFYPLLFCYNSSGTFLGIDHTDGAVSGMASPPIGIDWRDNNRTVTFTIASGSTIAYVGFQSASASHVTGDFTRVRDSVQLEEGYSATDLVAYTASTQSTLKSLALADDVKGDRLLRVVKANDLVYVRSSWSTTKDLVQRMRLHTGATYTTNDVVEFNSARLIPATTLDADTVSGYNSSTTVLSTQGDDAGPVKYNNTYIGAEHGANIGVTIPSTAHGKTVVDVGSEWTDGASRKWYIIRVPDANTLVLVSENTGASDKWTFYSSITGTTLTHSSGATHTSAITFASQTLGQVYPCVKNRTKTLLLDKRTPIKRDGVYVCKYFSILESYDITNPASMITYLRSVVGSAAQPQLNHPSIDSQSRVTVNYTFGRNGSCSIYNTFRAIQALNIDYWSGAIQAPVVGFSGRHLWQYVPRLSPIVGSLATYDFKSLADISGTFEQVDFVAATWTDPTNPPDRMAQLVKSNAGVNDFGHILGYSQLRGAGVTATRVANINTSGFMSSAKKNYMKLVTSGSTSLSGGTSMPVGSYYEAVSYRSFYNAALTPEASVFTWYWDGDDVVVIVDFHQNVSFKALTLPSDFIGKKVSIVDKTVSLALHSSDIVNNDGLLVSVTGGYGYALIKLY